MDLFTNLGQVSFIYLKWSYFLTNSEFTCLAKLAKQYRVCGPTCFFVLSI